MWIGKRGRPRVVHGFKAMSPNMTCLDFKYEVGKTYELGRRPVIYKRGFHFCQCLGDVLNYHNRFNCLIFEVEALGKVVTDGNTSCTNRLRIVRRLDPVAEGRARYGIGCGDGFGYGYSEDCLSSDGRGDGWYCYLESGNGGDDENGNGFGDGRGYGDRCGCGWGQGYDKRWLIRWEERGIFNVLFFDLVSR